MSDRPAARRIPLAFACLLLALLTASACGPRTSGKLVGHTRPIPKQVGGLSMSEARLGKPDTTFTFRAKRGGLLFVFFGFTNCPDLCPTTLGDLRKALRKVGPGADKVDVAFVTVDPGRDSSEAMARYLGSFFTGGHPLRPADNEQLLAVQAAFGAASSVTRKADGDVDVAHTALSYLVDEHGAVLLEWDYGTSPADLAHDLRLLLARNAGGTK
ncbi:MAG: SCO family protein [Candidatus Eisenbacteria bacterium]|uniref:SCO family protein n=1 Tax=Eiseniibacteriota bacterium TaxID=2212470 RepID=A0A933SB47_UNCEI|nr:SCO family protein [Candidatus Eisenbacteria bacterium]